MWQRVVVQKERNIYQRPEVRGGGMSDLGLV